MPPVALRACSLAFARALHDVLCRASLGPLGLSSHRVACGPELGALLALAARVSLVHLVSPEYLSVVTVGDPGSGAWLVKDRGSPLVDEERVTRFPGRF